MVRSDATRNLPNISSSKYCVAYIDFLGARKKICASKDKKFFKDLKNIYKYAIQNLSELYKGQGKDIQIKVFSDNIVFFIKLFQDENDILKINAIINLVALFQGHALTKGYLTRGAITRGEFLHNDVFVYGKALVQAVELEENIAIYPRVIVSEDCLDCYKTITENDWNCNSCRKNELSTEMECVDYCMRKAIRKDIDGLYMVNFFISHFGSGLGKSFKEQILSNLNATKAKDVKIRQKIFYLIDYHNKFCKDMYITTMRTKENIISLEEVSNATKN